MDAKNLMLGDWVNTPNGISRVIYIAKYSGIYTDNTNIGEKLYSPYEINPIPLTPEILEKNGFAYFSIGGAEQWLINDDYYDINVYEYSDSIWVFRYDCTEMSLPHTQVTMSYVHELQHCLKMVGIDKEIVL